MIALAPNSVTLFCMDTPSAYWSYANMKSRCYNRNHPRYRDWGGRGIKVCDRWRERITGFQNFMIDMGPRPDGYQIDRIDNSGDYEPSNCQWAAPEKNSAFGRRRKRVDNKSGVPGVIFNNRTQQWQASITIKRCRHHLGWFNDKNLAIVARKTAERKYANTFGV
jgi:hypothetical protein